MNPPPDYHLTVPVIPVRFQLCFCLVEWIESFFSCVTYLLHIWPNFCQSHPKNLFSFFFFQKSIFYTECYIKHKRLEKSYLNMIMENEITMFLRKKCISQRVQKSSLFSKIFKVEHDSMCCNARLYLKNTLEIPLQRPSLVPGFLH